MKYRFLSRRCLAVVSPLSCRCLAAVSPLSRRCLAVVSPLSRRCLAGRIILGAPSKIARNSAPIKPLSYHGRVSLRARERLRLANPFCEVVARGGEDRRRNNGRSILSRRTASIRRPWRSPPTSPEPWPRGSLRRHQRPRSINIRHHLLSLISDRGDQAEGGHRRVGDGGTEKVAAR